MLDQMTEILKNHARCTPRWAHSRLCKYIYVHTFKSSEVNDYSGRSLIDCDEFDGSLDATCVDVNHGLLETYNTQALITVCTL